MRRVEIHKNNGGVKVKVELLHHTPLWVCARAIRTCWCSHDKSDTDMFNAPSPFYECGDKDKALIERVGNKNKHSSTLEHLVYTFNIDGISRACLQELARHRMASLSVKSTRYTLKKLKEVYFTIPKNVDSEDWATIGDYVVLTDDLDVNIYIARSLKNLCDTIQQTTTSNDILKYQLPEAFKTSLVWTINARSLQNFLSLRLSNNALWEIRQLAKEVYMSLPEEHKYLFPVPPEDIKWKS